MPSRTMLLIDTDGDDDPDELFGESTTGLVEDMDDDNDGWSDVDEAECGQTDPKNRFDTPVDSDGDGICDFNEDLSVSYGEGEFELLQGQRNVTLQPIITGMTVDIWKISPALPYGLFFSGDTMARTSNGNGTIYGVPLIPSNLTEYTVTAINLLTGKEISTTFNLSVAEDYDLDGLPNNNSRLGLFEADFDDDGDGFNDSFELECGGDPYNRSSVPKIESDGSCYEFRSYEQPPERDRIHSSQSASDHLPRLGVPARRSDDIVATERTHRCSGRARLSNTSNSEWFGHDDRSICSQGCQDSIQYEDQNQGTNQVR